MNHYKDPYYYRPDEPTFDGEIIREIMSMTKCNIRTAKKIVSLVEEAKRRNNKC